jgi:hypothetical protein
MKRPACPACWLVWIGVPVAFWSFVAWGLFA